MLLQNDYYRNALNSFLFDSKKRPTDIGGVKNERWYIKKESIILINV